MTTRPPARMLSQDSITAHCAVCNHEWRSPLPLPMPVDRAVRALNSIIAAGCPRCGADGRSVLCGEAPRARGKVVES